MLVKTLVFHLRFKSGIRQGTLSGDVNRQAGVIAGSTVWGGVGWASAQINGPDITEQLVRSCKLSSLLWKRGKEYYVPAPVFPVTGESMDIIKDRKKIKKIQWVPVDKLDKFIQGKIDFDSDVKFFDVKFFVEETVVSAALDRATQAAVPFYRRRLRVEKDVHGVLVAECPDDLALYMQAALNLLKDIGLGGERSTGWGVFDLETLPAEETPFGAFLGSKGSRYLTLGAFLPKPEEIPLINQDKRFCGYDLWRFRGYVGTTDVIKPTVVCLSHGSLLSFKPEGQVIDITPARVEHPVLFNGSPPSIPVNVPLREGVAL